MIFDAAKEEFEKSRLSEHEDFDSSVYKCAAELITSPGGITWSKQNLNKCGHFPRLPYQGEIKNASFDTVEIQYSIAEKADFHNFTRNLKEKQTVLSSDLACDLYFFNDGLISLIHAENLAENFTCPSEDSFCSDFFIDTIHEECIVT